MKNPIKNNRHETANEHLGHCEQSHEKQQGRKSCVKLSLDIWFLQDLIKHLTPHANEEVVYVTGQSFDNMRIPYRICGFELDEQSVVYAKGTARSCSDALIEIIEKGYNLQLVAHSHPGNGKSATTPSGIDINYLDKIQKNDSEAAGVIVTRDGYVRFFTSRLELDVSIEGMEVEYVGDNVFKIPLI